MSKINVFVNGGLVEVPTGAGVREAVGIFDATLEQRLTAGTAYVTDGRGIEINPAEPLTNGAILRVVVRARRGADADA